MTAIMLGIMLALTVGIVAVPILILVWIILNIAML